MSAVEDLTEGKNADSVAAECVAFVGDNQTHNVVAAVTREYFAEPLVRDGATQQVIEYLSESHPPTVLIVDVSDAASPLTAMMSLTAAIGEETRIIGIGAVNDITLYREIIDVGATDYLVKPVTEKALASALLRTDQQAAPSSVEQIAKVQERIAVIGARGGAGASSFAINLAWMLSDDLKQRTALVDLDLEFGTAALSLDLEPTRGLREALENPSRIDSLFISSATAKMNDTLSIMATEENSAGEQRFNPNAIDVLLEALGRNNDVIVIDLPRTAPAYRSRVFEAATRVVVVTELNLPSLRDSIRLLASIAEIAPDKPITVVANRTGGNAQAMPPGEFQKALGRRIDMQLQDVPKAFNKAINTGQPVVQVDKRGKVAKAMRKFIDKCVELEQPQKQEKAKRGWFGKPKKV